MNQRLFLIESDDWIWVYASKDGEAPVLIGSDHSVRVDRLCEFFGIAVHSHWIDDYEDIDMMTEDHKYLADVPEHIREEL